MSLSSEEIVGGSRRRGGYRSLVTPAVPAVWGTSDVSTEKVMGSSVKIMACLTDNDDSCVNQGVVADV